MSMPRTTTASRLWSRTAKTLGKFWHGMVTLPEDPRRNADQNAWTDFPRFPPF
ncbi:MAG TPA: hypothetical protein VFC56_08210 [Stellaceae bacterium]|nr:hypothetical protein [Stellaceae bacterium]